MLTDIVVAFIFWNLLPRGKFHSTQIRNSKKPPDRDHRTHQLRAQRGHSEPRRRRGTSQLQSAFAMCAKRDQSAQVRSFASLRMTPRRRGMVISSPAHKTIVSPRVGPTLTIDSFAPANSAMYLTYFFAAEGSCENFRAACVDAFQPRTSS